MIMNSSRHPESIENIEKYREIKKKIICLFKHSAPQVVLGGMLTHCANKITKKVDLY